MPSRSPYAVCLLGFLLLLPLPMSSAFGGGGLYIGGLEGRRSRLPRQSEAPQISMRAVSRHWLKVTCTVPRHSAVFNVFVTCPTLSSAPCYENCIPTKPCTQAGTAEARCLPDLTTVNCTQQTLSTGASTTTLWIDKRDTRLHGLWECTSLGVRSSAVEIAPETEEDEKAEPVPPTQPPPSQHPVDSAPSEEIDAEPQLEATPSPTIPNEDPTLKSEPQEHPALAAIASFLSQSPWIFCILAIFIISLTINLILWIRWCIVCIFTARRRKYNDEQKALGNVLCLPTQVNKSQSALWENELFSGPLSDCYPNTSAEDPGTFNAQRFGTFGPSSYFFDNTMQQPMNQHSSFTDLAFPQFNTMQPDHQMWRSRTNAPAGFSMANGRTNRLRSGTASPHQQPPSFPRPPLIDTSGAQLQSLKEPRRFPRVSMSPPILLPPPVPPPTQGTLYDDVATSSTITTTSKTVRTPSFTTPHLPSTAERMELNPRESTSTTVPAIYSVHRGSTQMQRQTFRGVEEDHGDADVLNSG